MLFSILAMLLGVAIIIFVVLTVGMEDKHATTTECRVSIG